MAIKYTIQGFLLYGAAALYLLAFLITITRKPKTGQVVYFLGFITVVTAFGYRWAEARHVPMQTMFEVFLCLGMIYPISVFCRKFLQVGLEAADMILGVIILFPAGFIFPAAPRNLPPALQSWIFIPHVAVYMLAYIILAKAAVQALFQLCRSNGPADPQLVDYERATYRMVCLGFPLLSLGLLLGCYWGKQAWGDFWHWDPKELWSFVSWLVFLGYFHFRSMHGRKHPRINSVWALAGLAAIIITLLWANLSRLFTGMHNYAA